MHFKSIPRKILLLFSRRENDLFAFCTLANSPPINTWYHRSYLAVKITGQKRTAGNTLVLLLLPIFFALGSLLST